MYDLIDFFVAALTHPIFFGFLSLMCFLLLRSILQGGQRLSVLYDAIDRHIETMASQNEQKAWDGLSFDLKNILLDKRRERKGPEYVGIARLKDFMTRLASLYQRESLIVDSLHEVRKVQRPRRMFMVRLRSSRTGFLRLTIWLSYVPFRGDGWSVVEVCAHPPNGDVTRGETLTGSRMRPSRLQQRLKNNKKSRTSTPLPEVMALAKS